MSESSMENPFPGLRPFRTDEHHLFFGREEQTAELLQLLRRHRFLAVVGTSGSGKSSLVKAGLVPALHRGTMTQAGSSWEVVLLRPGGNPISNLARALVESELYDSQDAESLPRLQATLSRSLYGLVEAVRQSDMDPATNLLVVVDQFEEIFRFRQRGMEAEEAAGAFVRLLLTAAEQEEQRIFVAITMRSDYLGDCSQIAGLAEAVNRGEYLIPRLLRDQKRDAIEKPVGVGGAQIAPRLVQRILNDVGDDPDQLPVLQHALMRTFDAWSRSGAVGAQIELEDYEGIGGMEEALSRHADEVFGALPGDVHRAACERIFKSLTEKGADNRGIRRPRRLEDLTRIANADRGIVSAVVDAFRSPGVTFLMPGSERDLTDTTVVDLSHESLMRVWARLRSWVEEEAQSARVYRRLAETAELWREGKAGLFRDPDLQIAVTWREATHPNAAWAAQYGGGFESAMAFLDGSRAAADAEAETREASRRRELEQANALATAERNRAREQQRAAKRFKTLSVSTAFVAVAAILAFVLAAVARKDALKNEEAANLNAGRAAEKERAAVDAAGLLKQNLARSDFEAGVEKIEAGDGAEGLSFLARCLRTNPESWQAGARLLSTLASGRFPLRKPALIEQQRVITEFVFNAPQDLVYTSDSSEIREAEERWVWDARTANPLWKVAPGSVLSSPTWSQDGLLLMALLPSEGTIRAWESRTGKEAELPALGGKATGFELKQDAKGDNVLLARYADGGMQVWRVGSAVPATPRLRGSDVSGITQDGTKAFALNDQGTINVWETSGGRQLAELSTRPHPTGRLEGLLFSPDGKTLACFSDTDKQVNWWPPEEAGTPGKWIELEDPSEGVFLPGSRRLAIISRFTPSTQAILRASVYDLATRERVSTIESPRPVTLFSRFGRATPWSFGLLGTIEGSAVRIWDLESGKVVREIFTPWLLGMACFTPEGRRVLTVSSRYELMIWSVLGGTPLLPEPIVLGAAPTLQFSPDGEKLVTHDAQERLVRIWSTRTGRQLFEPVAQTSLNDAYFIDGGQGLLSSEIITTTRGKLVELKTTGRLHVQDIRLAPALPEPLLDGGVGAASLARFTADGKRIVVQGKQRAGDATQVMIWDSASRQLVRSMPLPDGVYGFARAFSLSPDSRRVALGSSDGRARVWDVESGTLVHDLPHTEPILGVVAADFGANGTLLATATASGKVRIWDCTTGSLVGEPVEHGTRDITVLRFSPDGNLLASGSVDLRARIYDVRGRAMKVEPLVTNGLINDVEFSRDGTYLAVVPFSSDALIVEAATGKLIRTLQHNDACRRAAFSPDGKLIAVGTGGNYVTPAGNVQVWNWRDGITTARPMNARGSVELIEISADGSRLVTGTLSEGRGAVQVWDVASGRPLIDPVVGKGTVSTISFNPGADEVVAAWIDGSVQVIDLPPRSATSPAWLPRLAEAVAGKRMVPGAEGVESVPAKELEEARTSILAEAGQEGPALRWARWFLSSPGDRTISPRSKLTLREYVAKLRSSDRVDSLQDALRLSPDDALTHARLGNVLLDQLATFAELDPRKDVDAALRRHWESTTEWYGKRAVDLEPRNAAAWAIHAEILQRIGKKAESSVAVARAMELDPSRADDGSPNAFYLKAISLAGSRDWAKADEAFEKALDGLSRAAGDAGRKNAGVPYLGILAALEPRRAPGGFRDIHLPEPIPGSFQDFDAVPEGRVPTGWTVRHATPDAAPDLSAAGRLDYAQSNTFDDWTAVSVDRALLSPGQPFTRSRLLAVEKSQRLNGTIPDRLLSGRFLLALSANRDSSHVQYLTTPDFECTARAGVHVAFQSAYEQANLVMAELEYSIDQGKTWLPVLYRISPSRVAYDAAGKLDAAATLKKAQSDLPLYLDEDGHARGTYLGELVGAEPSRDLDPFFQLLPVDLPGKLNQVEVFRLPRADGQKRVRLRFLHAGRYGWFWAIDNFGLYEIQGDAITGAPRLDDLTRDPRFLANAAIKILLGQDLRAWTSDDLSTLLRATEDDPAGWKPRAGSVTGQAGASAPTQRQRLDAALVARRAMALAKEDPVVHELASSVLLWAGELDDAERALRVALASRPIAQGTAFALAGIFMGRGLALEQAADPIGAGVAHELAYALWRGACARSNGSILERLARAGLVSESRLLLDRGSEWRYVDDGRELGESWRDPAYDDALWQRGKAPLGYGGDGEVTRLSYGPDARKKPIAVYFRTQFDAPDASQLAQLRLGVRRDDGVVVYLNGKEVARDNMPRGDIQPGTLALASISDDQEGRYISLDAPIGALLTGRNVLAVEVHQQTESSSDLGFDLELRGIGGLKAETRPLADLDAIEERLAIPRALRSVLWTSRAERARLSGRLELAAAALERAGRLGPDNPSVAYETAMLLDARGERESAHKTYIEAAARTVALKAGAPGSFWVFLPESWSRVLEPVVELTGVSTAVAAGILAETSVASKETEARWLLRWSEELDSNGEWARIERATALLALGRPEEALPLTDRSYDLGLPAADTPARLVHARDEWLDVRQQALRRLGRPEEADAVRDEVLQIRPRNPALSPGLIDLTLHYNANLYDGRGWHGNQTLKTLAETFRPRDGVGFDIRGLIQLNSGVFPPDSGVEAGKDVNSLQKKSFPYAVTDIRVGLEAKSLHFLIACIYSRGKRGTEVGRVAVHYEDGTQATIPLRLGEDLVDWAAGQEQVIEPGRVAWLGGRPPRALLRKDWSNPSPEKPIRALDFVSARSVAGPFLVAVTAK